MSGSLLLAGNVLYVGDEAKTARVRSFDLDGRPLGVSLTFRDEAVGRSAAAGLALDDEHRLWVADTPANRVRAFTLFGREVAGLGGETDPPDARGRLAAPTAVRLLPEGWLGEGPDGPRPALLAVASGGMRRHALALYDPEERRCALDLRPPDGPRGRFRDLVHLAVAGERLLACERGTRRLLVYRRDAFHFALGPWDAEPSACAPLADGRFALALRGPGGGVLVVDAAGGAPRRLAVAGSVEGEVDEPCDLVVSPGPDERRTRVVVLDREGERVQVFSLAGHCHGAFHLAG